MTQINRLNDPTVKMTQINRLNDPRHQPFK
jgi:hypothetical protein